MDLGHLMLALLQTAGAASAAAQGDTVVAGLLLAVALLFGHLAVSQNPPPSPKGRERPKPGRKPPASR